MVQSLNVNLPARVTEHARIDSYPYIGGARSGVFKRAREVLSITCDYVMIIYLLLFTLYTLYSVLYVYIVQCTMYKYSYV